MMIKFLNITLLFLFIIGLAGASTLVYDEYTNGSVCPTLALVPACYIILLCFAIPFATHLFGWNKWLYFLGTGIAVSIAFYGSVMQFLDIAECPKTSFGVPMCYLSFLIFGSLILLKLALLNLNSNLK